MTGPAIPQTRAVMEAGFTLREGIGEQFWRAHDTATLTAARQHCPGATATSPDVAAGLLAPAIGLMDPVGRDADVTDPPAFPGRGPRLAELPLTLILTAEYAALRHEMNALADDLRAQGVPVTRHQFADVDHVFTHARHAEVARAAIHDRPARQGRGRTRTEQKVRSSCLR